jgi:sugar phosphate isomerase/epimerase
MKRKLSITTDCIKGESPLDTLDRIKKAGFDMVFISTPSIDLSCEIKKKADALGLETEFIHAPFKNINTMWANDNSKPEILDGMKHTVDMAQKAGIPVVVVHASSTYTPPEICDAGLRRFDELVDYAKKKGIILAFENLRKIGNITYLVDRYENRDNVRFCYDAGHEHGCTRFVSFADIFRDRIICTHIHDNFGYTPDSDPDLHLLPFDGNIDYKKMMKKLKEYSYSGPITLEVFNSSGDGRYSKLSPDEFIKTAYKRALKISKM